MTPLQQIIIERIERDGPIPFADYMHMALYEPQYGYYVSGAPRIGWEGDYYTSTDLSSLFASCMGRQLQQMWEKLKRPSPFIVVEQGAGRGHLAQSIASWAQQEVPDFHKALNYHREDIRFGQNAIMELPTSTDTERAPSVILSNELIDAFPVHIVEVRDTRLYEVYVDVQNGRLCEVLDEPSLPQLATYLEHYTIPWQSFGDGWRAEINLDALHWIEHSAQRIAKGFILTIDYGEKAKQLYIRERRHGTLMCYYQHQMNERPLAYPGQQDITAHVNFSALIDQGRRHGLRLNTFTTQRLWLERMGIYEEAEQLRKHKFAIMDTERATDQGQVARLQWLNLRHRIAALTEPTGMGNFKVLILRR
ncbi:MAG: SAM-dependent methyltransferase [Chloroflexota bacterium]|nr:SAM-dependent methyltransferase [Chloroflexota bacterium]